MSLSYHALLVFIVLFKVRLKEHKLTAKGYINVIKEKKKPRQLIATLQQGFQCIIPTSICMSSWRISFSTPNAYIFGQVLSCPRLSHIYPLNKIPLYTEHTDPTKD